MTRPSLVVIESPFAADLAEAQALNIDYARSAVRDSLQRGEAPFASHLLYTQTGILDDRVAEERRQGIEAGLTWGSLAELTAVYVDLGISRGMQEGIRRAQEEGRPIVERSLPAYRHTSSH